LICRYGVVNRGKRSKVDLMFVHGYPSHISLPILPYSHRHGGSLRALVMIPSVLRDRRFTKILWTIIKRIAIYVIDLF
jgi:hypothetical protein